MFMYLQGSIGGDKSMSPSWGEYPGGICHAGGKLWKILMIINQDKAVDILQLPLL